MRSGRCLCLNRRSSSIRRIGFAWAGRGECQLKGGNLPDAEQSLRRAAELAHEPRVTEHWQQVRAMMGLPLEAPM